MNTTTTNRHPAQQECGVWANHKEPLLQAMQLKHMQLSPDLDQRHNEMTTYCSGIDCTQACKQAAELHEKSLDIIFVAQIGM